MPYEGEFWRWVAQKWRDATTSATPAPWLSGDRAEDPTWSFVVRARDGACAVPLCGLDGAGVLLRLRARDVEHSTVMRAMSDRAQLLCGLGLYSTSKTVGPLAKRRRDEQQSGGAAAAVGSKRPAPAGASTGASSDDDDDDDDDDQAFQERVYADDDVGVFYVSEDENDAVSHDDDDGAAAAAPAEAAASSAIEDDYIFALRLQAEEDEEAARQEEEEAAAASASDAASFASVKAPPSRTAAAAGSAARVERLIKGQCWSEGKWYGGWYDQEKRTFYQKKSKNGWKIENVYQKDDRLKLDQICSM